ncbi:MAG TPA: hypothetical protein VFO89_16430 [Thermoanaerobaculia bacterium]|nr:hypothetical protein [Thermoanaerobaculia bacterium]
MPRESFLRIAGITMRVVRDDPRAVWRWEEPAARFLVDPAPAEVEIAVRVGFSHLPPSALLFDSGAVWSLHRTDRGFRIDCRSEAFGGVYKIALFDESFTRGTIHLREDLAALHPLDYPLDEVLVAQLLGRGRGVELHSCGIIDDAGRGRLFAGVSGAGKTTTARLWSAHARGVVSDDRVIVREVDGAMWMFGTPWHGEAELSLPGGVPLAGVYLLEQAHANELRELPAAEAVARMFRCSFPPFHDAQAVGFTLSFLEKLAAAVPVRELRFTRDPEAVAVVLRG